MQDLLTIGELSARSGVAPSALRYYERLGLIRADRTGGNQRRYARAELRRVAFIRISQQVGVSLDEIREALDSLPESRTPARQDWARLSGELAEPAGRADPAAHQAPRRPGRLHRLRLPVLAALHALQPGRHAGRRGPRRPAGAAPTDGTTRRRQARSTDGRPAGSLS